MNSWIAWQGVTTEDPLGKRLADLAAETSYGSNRVREMYKDERTPLPVLTAEATVKGLVEDGTNFANLDVSVFIFHDVALCLDAGDSSAPAGISPLSYYKR